MARLSGLITSCDPGRWTSCSPPPDSPSAPGLSPTIIWSASTFTLVFRSRWLRGPEYLGRSGFSGRVSHRDFMPAVQVFAHEAGGFLAVPVENGLHDRRVFLPGQIRGAVPATHQEMRLVADGSEQPCQVLRSTALAEQLVEFGVQPLQTLLVLGIRSSTTDHQRLLQCL